MPPSSIRWLIVSKKAKEYNRLPGKKRGPFWGYDTLWLGKDHLLRIDSKVFVENYKRFYYGDIQAIVTRKTAQGKILNILLGLLGGLFIFLAVQLGEIGLTVFGILAGLTLFSLLINWLRGPTCVCHLHTAVQTEKLPSLNRLRTTRKAMNRLRPLIEKAQGAITPEALQTKVLEWPRAETAKPRISPASQPRILTPHGGEAPPGQE